MVAGWFAASDVMQDSERLQSQLEIIKKRIGKECSKVFLALIVHAVEVERINLHTF